jgi:RHS repeat-associated protein
MTPPIGGSPKVLASAVTWRADGRLTGRTFGNGLRESRAYDARGQLRTQQLGADTTTYHYDPAGNLLARSLPDTDHGWDYDALDRVIRDRLDTRERTYAYDPNHNRASALVEGTPEIYSHAPASNRLTGIATPATSRMLSLDAAGNLTDDGAGQTFSYNQAGRLATAETAAGTARYRYNALGLRTHKEGMTSVVFHYDAGGRLLAETTPEGHVIRSYVWFGDEPLAQLDGPLDAETPTYLHTDHLTTPRLGTDASGIPVWRWESPAFGDAAPSLQLRTVNLRFPGQYFDSETELHYNYFRYYDPGTGRYITADPIGQLGGINLFTYADLNPINAIDRFGLRGTITVRPPQPRLSRPRNRDLDDALQNAPDPRTTCGGLLFPCVPIFKCVRWECDFSPPPPPNQCPANSPEPFEFPGTPVMSGPGGFNPGNDPRCKCVESRLQ